MHVLKNLAGQTENSMRRSNKRSILRHIFPIPGSDIYAGRTTGRYIENFARRHPGIGK